MESAERYDRLYRLSGISAKIKQKKKRPKKSGKKWRPKKNGYSPNKPALKKNGFGKKWKNCIWLFAD